MLERGLERGVKRPGRVREGCLKVRGVRKGCKRGCNREE